MQTNILDIDYLVIGTGCMGMAFTDTLISHSDKRVVMVDRNANPGGHWNQAYPFVELHAPARLYGVDSTLLGKSGIDVTGLNAGLQERATGHEVLGYYQRVMDHRFTASGQVQHYPLCNYMGEGQFVSRISGQKYAVGAGTVIVYATYVAAEVPANTPPPFEVDEGATCIPVGELVHLKSAPRGFTIVGAGKTAMDACIYLLQQEVDPHKIRWIKPQESWLWCREMLQAGDRVARFMQAYSRHVEAAANAKSIEDFLLRCEAVEYLVRVDTSVSPTMFRAATVSAAEVEQLRRIENVVRLGHVQRIERDQIVLDGGSISTAYDEVHVHCAAYALNNKAAVVPIFGDNTITLQQVQGPVSFDAGLVGFVEALELSREEKNALCPASPFLSTHTDIARSLINASACSAVWATNPQVASWVGETRLSFVGGMMDHLEDPVLQEAMNRFGENIGPAVENMTALLAEER